MKRDEQWLYDETIDMRVKVLLLMYLIIGLCVEMHFFVDVWVTGSSAASVTADGYRRWGWLKIQNQDPRIR